jgi:hypothetical protein
MKGYLLAYDRDNNFYCVTIETCKLIPEERPVINPKFAKYYSTQSLKIQKIYLLEPYKTGEIDEIEADIVNDYYFSYWYLLKKGGVLTNTNNLNIYKSKQSILHKYEFFKKKELRKTYTGIIKNYLCNGDLFLKRVFINGFHLKSFEYYDNYVLKQYHAKNFSVVIDLQRNSKRKIKGIVSFGGQLQTNRFITSPDHYYTVDHPSQTRCQQRIYTWKSFEKFDITDGFKNVIKKGETKNNKTHGSHFDTFRRLSLCIYKNDCLISHNIMGLFQLPEFKYVHTRHTFKIK